MIVADARDDDDVQALDRPRRRRIAKQAFPYVMFAPAFLLIAGISFLPIGYAITQSFHRSSNLNLGRYVGLQNYADFLFARNGFGSIVNSLVFVGGTVLIALPLGLALALPIAKPIPARGLIRTV